MGIPHLITLLQPYAEVESIGGRCVVIDGPGLAYHIYHTCLSGRPAAWNPFEAAPSYKELVETCIAWLDVLRDNNVEIKKIFFDGFLPPPKLHTRLERLVKQTNQLSQYHSANATPCRHSFPPRENGSRGSFHTPAVKLKLTALPPIPFLVPAILEGLLESSQYRDITEVVPGEADLYCAKYLNQRGGIVLTGDSDLLVHELGEDGAVSFFKDIEFSAHADGQILRGSIYHPMAIAQRLDLPKPQGLRAFAFELSSNSNGTFRKLLVDARSLKAVTANPSEFKSFLKEYKQLPEEPSWKSSSNILPLLRSIDPRISEYVLQYPHLAETAGQAETTEETHSQRYHVFLPFLLDCPIRTNAWEVSTVIRQLAYGLINLIVPESQQRQIVSEHRKQQDKSSGRELQLPSMSQLPDACTAVSTLYCLLQQSLPTLSKSQIWTAFAIHQDVEYSYSRVKMPLSKLVVHQLADPENKSDGRKNFTWDIVQFFAQIQGSYYSFRILKQIMALVVSHGPDQSIPEPLLCLHQQLESLPKLGHLLGLRHVSCIIEDLGKGGMSTITRLIVEDEELGANPQESRRALKKKRKRGQSAAGPIPDREKPSNPFELLGDE